MASKLRPSSEKLAWASTETREDQFVIFASPPYRENTGGKATPPGMSIFSSVRQITPAKRRRSGDAFMPIGIIAAVAMAQTLTPNSVLGFGIGVRQSCASWQSTPAQKAQGDAWILGMWTGLNAMRSSIEKRAAVVGHSTDGLGVIAEVKLECDKEPSSDLMDKVNTVYARFNKSGR